MTFSDAEEDQPSGLQNGAATPNGLSARSSRPDSNAAATSDNQEATEDVKTDESTTSNLSKETASSSCIPTSVSSSSSPTTIMSVGSVSQSNSSAGSQLNGIAEAEDAATNHTAEPDTAEPEASSSSSTSPPQPATPQVTDEVAAIAVEGGERSNTSDPASGSASETTPPARESGTSSGSASIGVVGNLNEDGRHTSMQDRLAEHQGEQVQLSERLRESLVRRQELMTRYQATRERLNNLKRQRQGLVHEERRLLQSVGAPENPYDDPIPGSDTWTIEQLESAIRDFEGLKTKVDNLHQAYLTKMEAIDETDTEGEARNDLQRKIEQILNKKRQIATALTQMTELLQVKRERGEEESDLNLDPEPSVDAGPSEDSVPSENPDPPLLENPAGEVHAQVEGNMDPEGAVGVSAEAADIQAKQQHLQSLKNQLAAMKKLLYVSENAMPTDSTAAFEH